MRAFFIIFAIAFAILVGGFVHFANSIPNGAQMESMHGDAIIALTGGPRRISIAVNLLKDQRADRLLITGVNDATTKKDLVRLTGVDTKLFDCCIDLDYAAKNTIGNASQASTWTKQNGFKRLILVTSNFHMPRSLLVFSSAMPKVELTPYPVIVEKQNGNIWWKNQEVTKQYAAEYPKYLYTLIRKRVLDLISMEQVPDAI